MIKLVIARGPNDKFEEYLEPSLKNYPNVNFLEIYNEENDSIFKKYNRGIDQFVDYNLTDNDIVGFIHADVRIMDPLFEKKIELVFAKKPEVGIVGIIGTTSFSKAGGWWLCDHSLHRGHLIQGAPGSNGSQTFHMIRKQGYFEDLVSVDGFCFFVRGSVVKQIRFDETTYPEAYHFYDVDYCISVLESPNKWKIAVADILMEHASEGPIPKSWHLNRTKFINKMESKGYFFPLTKQQFERK